MAHDSTIYLGTRRSMYRLMGLSSTYMCAAIWTLIADATFQTAGHHLKHANFKGLAMATNRTPIMPIFRQFYT